MRLLLLLAIGAYCAVAEPRLNFDGHIVYRVFPATEDHNEILEKLESSNKFDFWSDINRSGLPVDIMVAPMDQKHFINLITSNGMNYEIFIDDVQKRISKEKVNTRANGEMTWTEYYTLDGIHAWLDYLGESDPDRVTVISTGNSFEGRNVKGVKISFRTGRRSVFIEGGIHAREWISPATVTYLINELLTSTDPAFRRIAESFDWYIFPSTNPDGYVYSHTTNRLWRKTRSPQGLCAGVDPNRNWNITWGETGTSTNPCSEVFGGPAPFSEPETALLSEFIASVGSSLDVYISFHSYSQLMLIPYGHTTEPLDNFEEVYAIGQKAVEALAVRYGTVYVAGNHAEVLYEASGNSIDWVKRNFQVPIVYLYELRDTGRHGFILPADQIIPNSEEVIDSLIAVFEEGSNMGYFPLD